MAAADGRFFTVPETGIPEPDDVPTERQDDGRNQPHIPPKADTERKLGKANAQNSRMAHKKETGQQQPAPRQPDSPRSPVGIQQHRRPQPEEEDGVE